MKRILTLIGVLLCLSAAVARPVSPERARQVALRYLPVAIDRTPEGWSELYLFTAPAGEGGFVIVAADDCAHPVLAYSATEQLNLADSLPPQVQRWLAGYRQELAHWQSLGLGSTPQVQAEWDGVATITLSSEVKPLLTTQWNQAPLYNSLCPLDKNGNRAVSGCVATAMTQIMKYWNHPLKGHGQHGYKPEGYGYMSVSFDSLYDWEQMPDKLSSSSSSAEVHAVAQLTYHVGVAVDMQYSASGSGALTNDYGTDDMSAEKALKTFFRYNPLLRSIWKEQHTDRDWDSLLRHELSHGRPILYSGRDNDGGHAFVIDGYDQQGLFHVNWGWGGWYNGYFRIDTLAPAGSGIGGNATSTYNQNCAAIVQIFPSGGNDTVAIACVQNANEDWGDILGNGDYLAYKDTLTLLAQPREGYRFDGWSSGLRYNPFCFVPNGDFTDTAHFAPIGTDTLGYAITDRLDAWQSPSGTASEWAIRIPARLRPQQRSLKAVQMYVNEPGYYVLNIYSGDTIIEANRLYSKTHNVDQEGGWATLPLAEAVPLVGEDDLWIAFRFSSSTVKPAAYSIYTGLPDGTWYKTADGWVRGSDRAEYGTWMVRALFEERDLAVKLLPDAYLKPTDLAGSGLYAAGQSVTIEATNSAPFKYWLFGNNIITDNPYTFTLTQDTIIHAVGHSEGISGVGETPLMVSTAGRIISTSAEVDFYDLQGRLLSTGTRFEAPAAGVYLLRTRGGAACRVAVQ